MLSLSEPYGLNPTQIELKLRKLNLSSTQVLKLFAQISGWVGPTSPNCTPNMYGT